MVVTLVSTEVDRRSCLLFPTPLFLASTVFPLLFIQIYYVPLTPLVSLLLVHFFFLLIFSHEYY